MQDEPWLVAAAQPLRQSLPPRVKEGKTMRKSLDKAMLSEAVEVLIDNQFQACPSSFQRND